MIKPKAAKTHVIVLEDDVNLQGSLLGNLRDHFQDFDFQLATTVSEAKDCLRKTRRRQNLITRLVIVDEDLGESEERGSDFIDFVNGRYPGIKKIMLTGKAREEDIAKAVNEGALDKFISKKLCAQNMDMLFDAINEALEADRGFIYNAMMELLKRADKEGGRKPSAILVAGKKRITPGELLQHISQETKIGQQHMKQFSKLLYSAFLEPEEFMEELERVRKLRKKAQGKVKTHSKRKKKKKVK